MKEINGIKYYSFIEVNRITGKSTYSLRKVLTENAELTAIGQKSFFEEPIMIGNKRFWTIEQIESIKEFFDKQKKEVKVIGNNKNPHNSYDRLKREYIKMEKELIKLRKEK